MTNKCTFTTAYNRPASSVMTIGTMHYQKPSKVKTSLGYAVDINKIYKDYCRTGQLPLNGAEPLYDENFVKYDDLISSMDIVNQATTYFSALPAEIKEYYGNSLPRFIKGLNQKDQFLIDKGLLNLPKETVTAPIPPADYNPAESPYESPVQGGTPATPVTPLTPTTDVNTAKDGLSV